MNVCFSMSSGIMSSFSSSIKEIDAVFLKFSDDLNTAEVSSSMGNNSSESLGTFTHNYFNLFLTLICYFIQ